MRRCYYHNLFRPECPTPFRCYFWRKVSDLGWGILHLIPHGTKS
jgi:hypothetical protein